MEVTYYELNIQEENREGYVSTSVFERMSGQCHLGSILWLKKAFLKSILFKGKQGKLSFLLCLFNYFIAKEQHTSLKLSFHVKLYSMKYNHGLTNYPHM